MSTERVDAIFDRVVDGPEGELTITADDMTEIDKSGIHPAAIEAKIDHAMKTRPGLAVRVSEDGYGGLKIKWRTA